MWIEIVGWCGMVVLLITFYLGSSGKWSDRQYAYHVFNLFAALAVFVNAMYKGVHTVAVTELAWAVIAGVGIINVFRHQRDSHALE